jgi:hypothetical protein
VGHRKPFLTSADITYENHSTSEVTQDRQGKKQKELEQCKWQWLQLYGFSPRDLPSTDEKH